MCGRGGAAAIASGKRHLSRLLLALCRRTPAAAAPVTLPSCRGTAAAASALSVCSGLSLHPLASSISPSSYPPASFSSAAPPPPPPPSLSSWSSFSSSSSSSYQSLVSISSTHSASLFALLPVSSSCAAPRLAIAASADSVYVTSDGSSCLPRPPLATGFGLVIPTSAFRRHSLASLPCTPLRPLSIFSACRPAHATRAAPALA